MKTITTSNGVDFIVDDDVYEELSKHNWCATKKNIIRHVIIGNSVSTRSVHQDVLGKAIGLLIDHINGNTRDNRRENLRHVDAFQSNFNKGKQASPTTSKYKGVHYRSRDNTYDTKIWFNQEGIYIGQFKNEEDAAIAYDFFAMMLFGDFGRTNMEYEGRTSPLAILPTKKESP